jgi:hypothetical protein
MCIHIDSTTLANGTYDLVLSPRLSSAKLRLI